VPQPSAWTRSAICWLAPSFLAAGAGDVEDLAAQRQDCLVGTVAGLLGRAAGRIALDDEQFRAFGTGLAAIGELARKAQLAHRGLAVDFLFLAPPDPFVGAVDHPFEQLVGFRGRIRQKMVERIAHGVFDNPLGLDGGELVLGLADEFRFADEDRQHADRRDHHVIGGDRGGALVAGQFCIGLQALGQRNPQARFMGAALGRRNGVAVGVDRSIAAVPGDGPFDREPWPPGRSVLPAKISR
jgi:hypothetical protein